MTVVLDHVRVRNVRRSRSSFYLNRSIGRVETFCGAPITDHDLAFHERRYKSAREGWTDADGRRHETCSRCLAIST